MFSQMLMNPTGLIYAGLIVAGGLLILRLPAGGDASSGVIAQRRFSLYLLAIGAVLLLELVFAARLSQNEQLSFIAPLFFGLVPALVGVLAMIPVTLKPLAGLGQRGRALAITLGLAILILIAASGRGNFGWYWEMFIPTASLSLIWGLHRKQKTIVVMSLVALVLLALSYRGPDSINLLGSPEWMSSPVFIIIYALPGLVLGLAAVAVANGLRQLSSQEGGGAGGERSWALPALLWFALATLLLGSLAYAILWASIWDQTIWDGIAGYVLVGGARYIVLAAGMWLVFAVQGWRRLGGVAFAVLVPMIIVSASSTVQPGTQHAVTAARAARIQRALESYHARTGSYPEELGELAPHDILLVPKPVVFFYAGNWCYLGAEESFRLSAIYREHSTAPIFVRIYASAGDPPETDPACERQLADIIDRFGPFFTDPIQVTPSSPW